MYNAAVLCVRVRKQQQVAGAVTSLAMKGQQACRLVSRSFSFLGCIRWLGSRVVSVLDSGAEGPGSNRIAAAMLSGNSLRQTVHTHRASDHQAAKLVAALLRVARVTAGLAESNGSLPPGL